MPIVHSKGLRHVALLPDMLEVGQANTIRCIVAVNGEDVYPESGTVSVFDAAGRSVVDEASVVIVEERPPSYSWSLPGTTPFGEGWRVRWTLTFSEKVAEDAGPVTLVFENEAFAVRKRLVCPVSIGLIWIQAPALQPGIAGGAVTNMTANDQESMIELAWVRVEQRLISEGRRPYLVLSAGALVEVTALTALALIFGALGHRLNEAHKATAESYRLQAEEAWKRVRLTYDETQNGIGDGVRVPAKRAGAWLGRGAS